MIFVIKYLWKVSENETGKDSLLFV